MGRIELVVAGENLTESARQGERQPYVGWYLSPVLGWLATHWVALLHWAAAEPPEMPDTCREDWTTFRRTVEALRGLDATAFERAHVPGEVLDSARTAFEEIDRPDLFEHRWSADRPYVEELSPAVAMYGGVSPDLGQTDVRALRDALAGGNPGRDGAELSGLVEHRPSLPGMDRSCRRRRATFRHALTRNGGGGRSPRRGPMGGVATIPFRAGSGHPTSAASGESAPQRVFFRVLDCPATLRSRLQRGEFR